MRNAHPRYMCYPSVVCVGKETEIVVFPRDNSRLFREDRQYELCVFAIGEDFHSYHLPLVYDHAYTVKDGCLRFTHTFEHEQEYSIRFRLNGVETCVPLYAVEEDLYRLRPLKGDLHTHTYYSDGQDGIAMTPADYREEGFDFFSLTDHNRMYPSELAAELYRDIPLGMHIMKGEEVHTPGSTLHIVHVGGENSVCSRYIHNRERYESEIDAIEAELTEIPDYYRRRAAMAKWACDKIHEANGVAIFAHPYWRPKNYNVSIEFSRILFGMKIFDAFELVGGTTPRGTNLQLSLWQEQALQGNLLSVVGSSDSHDHDYEKGSFGKRFTVVFARENSTEAILDAVRQGMCVAGELPKQSGDEVRFYGAQLRLVDFAHFLFENYFNETWRLCVGEGILMRRYAEGEPVGEVLSALADTVAAFYRKFYGVDPAPTIPEERLSFLQKCRELQLCEGPLTIGSLLEVNEKNARRE